MTTFVGLFVLSAFAVMFSRYEKQLWGSPRTPFAFVVYPFLALLFLTVLVGPSMRFDRLNLETVLVFALFFALFATASVAFGRVARANSSTSSLREAAVATVSVDSRDDRVGNIEYLILGGLLMLVFASSLLTRGGGVVVKGELGAGGIGGHLIEVGIAYLVIAVSQRGGQRLVRAAFVLLVIWLLAINQVKSLIFLPLAAAILYRWASGQLAGWKVAVIALAAPLTLGIGVYAYFGAAAAADATMLTPEFVRELTAHMVAYAVAGILGLNQLLMQVRTVFFGASGVEYAFAPIVNVARFIAGTGNYFIVVNPLYLIISSDLIDSNVFTVFGSLLYRGGWVGAVSLTLAYALASYWIWSRWRLCRGPVSCAAGSWWMAALLFTWFDPYFTALSFMEVMLILSVRGRVRLWRLRGNVPGPAPGTVPAAGY